VFLSSEIRWFLQGPAPSEVVEWFSDSRYLFSAGTRTDRYLVFPHAETAGVKFREDNFEVKTLVRVVDHPVIAKRIKGQLELWEKWTLKGSSVSHLFEDVREEDPEWFDITKSRLLRKFSLDQEMIREVDASGKDGFPDDGCNVEITEVETDRGNYWTIGFEAFARRKNLIENLMGVTRLFFGPRMPDIILAEYDSYSYPTFIRSILRGENK
jgi:hypothetical protein